MEINTKTKFAYGLGGLGKNIAFTMVSSYTLYYYNSVLGINAIFIGTMLMIARIFDAFNDPIMGIIVARTRSRFGKYKPWILTGALLNALVIIAMFNVPENLSVGSLKFYVTITYFLCGITYTLSDIPYWSIIPAVTRPGRVREMLSVFARSMSGIGSGLATIFTLMLVRLFGREDYLINYRKGFSILAIIIAVFYALSTIITVIFLPVESGDADREPQGLKELINALIKNDQAMVLSVIIVLFYSAVNLTLSLSVYLFDYDIAQSGQYTDYMVIIGIAQLLAMLLFYPLLSRHISNRSIFVAAIALAVLGYSIFMFLLIPDRISLGMVALPALLVALANGFTYVLITVFIAGAVDYGEVKTGRREESMIASLQTLMVKLASAVASFITGIGIEWVGFSAQINEQSKDTLIRFRLLYALPSLIFMIIALLLVHRRKDL